MDAELANSDVVFVGCVMQMSIEPRAEGNYRYEVKACRFEVLESFKGIDPKKRDIAVVTRMAESACGFPFELGNRYLVYASAFRGDMETNICRRPRVLAGPKETVVTVDRFETSPSYEVDESGRIEADRLREFLKKK